jgi:hypothetical protein
MRIDGPIGNPRIAFVDFAAQKAEAILNDLVAFFLAVGQNFNGSAKCEFYGDRKKAGLIFVWSGFGAHEFFLIDH